MTKVKGCKVTVALLVLLCMLACITVTIFNANQVNAQSEIVYFTKTQELKVANLPNDTWSVFDVTLHADNWWIPGADEASIEIKKSFGITTYEKLALEGKLVFVFGNGQRRTVTIDKDMAIGRDEGEKIGGLIGKMELQGHIRITKNTDYWGYELHKWSVDRIIFENLVLYNEDEPIHTFAKYIGYVG